jgi:ribosomal protein S3AE
VYQSRVAQVLSMAVPGVSTADGYCCRVRSLVATRKWWEVGCSGTAFRVQEVGEMDQDGLRKASSELNL